MSNKRAETIDTLTNNEISKGWLEFADSNYAENEIDALLEDCAAQGMLSDLKKQLGSDKAVLEYIKGS